MAYEPFLVSGLKTGKSIGVEPWLSLPDAFSTIENMHVNKGVLEKRLGYAPFAQMKHGAVAQTATTITGIHTYLNKGMPSLLFMDSKGVAGSYTGRCNSYNAVDGTVTDISSDLSTPIDIFSGSPSDFHSFVNLKGVGYTVNNVDQIHKWEGPGSAMVPFNIQVISTDSKTNHIDTCQFMFVIDDRLVLLGETMLGDWFPQRLRYSPVNQVDFLASGGGTDDAETQQRISAAGMIGKTVYAFFEGPDGGSFWRIRRTGNVDIPLEWERITNTEGSRSPHSGIEFDDGLVAIGLSDVVFYDGFKMKVLGLPHVRDILDEFNEDLIRSVYGYRQRERGRKNLLFSMADVNSSSIDRILDHNILEGNFTVHKSNQSFFLNCMGGFNGQKVPTMSELDDVVASDGALVSQITVDSRAVLGNPSPFTLIGCRNSRIYKWNSGEFDATDDINGTIAIKLLSSRWNPYVKAGKKTALEKIGFLVDNDANASFLASVFKDTSSSAYKTKTISCDGTGDKFWVWIFCNGEVGNFHRLGITHTERNNTPKIHAFMPFFDSAGRLDGS